MAFFASIILFTFPLDLDRLSFVKGFAIECVGVFSVLYKYEVPIFLELCSFPSNNFDTADAPFYEWKDSYALPCEDDLTFGKIS